MSRTPSTIRLTVNLPPEVYDTLVAVAKREVRPRTEVVRRALERYFEATVGPLE